MPMVLDMLAAWQAGGFASLTATFFCTLCNLKIQDIENLDKRTWPERDVGEHIQLARQWRDGQMMEEQENLFKNHGLRWSPLLELPYWNPILFTAIEPMHIFDAGLFQTHCRQVWGIDATAPSGDGLTSQSTKLIARPSASELDKWYELISKNPEHLREKLKGCAHDTLWHICNDNDLRRAGNKWQLAEAIVEWVSQLCGRNKQCMCKYLCTLQRQTVSPDTIRLHAVGSTEPIQQPEAVSATTTPQPGVNDSDAESRSIREGSVATDDSVSNPGNYIKYLV